MQFGIKALLSTAVLAALPSLANAQGLVTQKTISFAMADAAAHAALVACEGMGYKVSAAVVDRGGAIVVMLHGDGSGLHTTGGAERKAYTARTFGVPSADFVKRLRERPETAGSVHYDRVLVLPGGIPIKAGNEIVGAIGVSGSPGKDDDCSQAGINKIADQLK